MEYQLPIVVLARMITVESADNIVKSWKMSSEEAVGLGFLVMHREIPYTYDQIFSFVARGVGPWTLQNAVNYFAMKEQWNQYNLIRSVVFPSLPINGRDILAKGYRPGKEIGNIIRAAWDTFIESGYTMTREELLTTIPDHV